MEKTPRPEKVATVTEISDLFGGANAALLTTIGFILACTLCFMLAVRGLRLSEGKTNAGARQLLLDFVTGFLIAAPAFWLFTKLLAINLPGLTGTGWL